MIEPTLKALSEFFKSQGIACQTLKASADFPFDVVFFYPGDVGEDKALFEIRIVKQLEETIEPIEGLEVSPKGYFHLQFTLPLNVSIKDEALYELERFLMVLNRSCELPGFEINEPDKSVYYRYAMMISGDGIDPYVLMSEIGIITGIYMTFVDLIKLVACGKLNFDQAVQTIVKKVQENKV